MGPENFFFDFVTTRSYGEGQVVGWFAKKRVQKSRFPKKPQCEILCSGDFGQLSPVTFMPGRQSSLAVSIKTHPSFELFYRLKLKFMWRSAHDRRFTNFTNRLADGNAQDGIFDIDVPHGIRMRKSAFHVTSRTAWTFL